MDEETPRLCRRNLLFVSGLIMFYYYAGVNITGIKFVGAMVSFHNLNAIEDAMWLVWGYVFIRYLLIYVSEGKKEYHIALMKKIRDSINLNLMDVDWEVYREIKGDDFVLDTVVELRKGSPNGNKILSLIYSPLNWLKQLFKKEKNK